MVRYSDESLLKVYLKWARKFIKEFYSDESLYLQGIDDDYLSAQLQFFRKYLHFMKIEGFTLRKIKVFLDKQMVKRNKNRYLIQLEGGFPPITFIEVDELFEIDLMDSKSLVFYREIIIYNKRNRNWTEESAQKMIAQVRWDLEYDGDKAIINHSIEKDSLTLEVRVKDQMDKTYIGEL